MTLHEAVNLFAKEAPEGYEGIINLEKDAGCVELRKPDGTVLQIDGDDLTEMVLLALETAKEDVELGF